MARFGAILASCWALAGLMAIIAFPGTLAAAQGKPPLPGAGVPGFGPLVMPDDPGHSAIWGLMMRPDVINAINVDLQQQDAIRALYSKAQSSLQMKLRPGAVARERGGAPIAGQPTYEQQAADSASRMRSLRGSIYDEFASEVNKALRPPQVERLRALDLQWRGPLALADSSVAKAVGLSPEQAARASELLDQYHTAQLNVALASSERSPDPNTIDPAAQLQPMSFDELIRRRNLAQQKAQKVRDEASAKALALLTSAQKATWIRLLGKPFRFEGNGP